MRDPTQEALLASSFLLAVDVDQFSDAGGAVEILDEIEERRLLAVVHDQWVHRPLLQDRLRDPRSDGRLAERVRADGVGVAQPVASLSHGLERRRRRVHAVVSDITRPREA